MNDKKNDPGTKIICGCFDLSINDIRTILNQDSSMSYDGFLKKTGAGAKCTACLLDLEHYFVKNSQNKSVSTERSEAVGTLKLPLKRRLYNLIDRLTPSVPVKLINQLPVISSDGVDQFIWVANNSLLFEGNIHGSPMDIKLIVRDSVGNIVFNNVYKLNFEENIRVNVSDFIKESSETAVDGIKIGSVEVIRISKKIGVRGTTRPQMEIVAAKGNCVVHGQAASRNEEGGFTCLYRPEDENLYLTILNAGEDEVVFNVEFPMNESNEENKIKDRVVVPAGGASMYKIELPSEIQEKYKNEIVNISWKSKGLRKTHILCSSKNNDSFSIDHL